MKLMRKNKKAFTLIELIAVLVILAIIALIATPLVMNIVKKAKDSANKRSVDGYGKSVELAVATYLLDNGEYPTDLNGLTVEYSGNEVVCNVKILNEDGSIYLSECSVKGTEVRDSSTEDGFYHYGKTSNVPVTYQSYNVGDVVTYNGMDFYVIENSDETSDRVTMLKAEPLTVDEINTYGVGHVNRYMASSVGTAYNNNGYGGMAYYTSETCGYVNGSGWVHDGCTTDYAQSEVKYVVDAWANDKIISTDLTKDSLGNKTRLLTFEDLINNLGYSIKDGEVNCPPTPDVTPSWVYNDQYYYWTMSQYESSTSSVWLVDYSGYVRSGTADNIEGAVRPVITLLKSSI